MLPRGGLNETLNERRLPARGVHLSITQSLGQ
jgi:hypothetical protein